jgi:signal transduction histidine kinase
LLHQVDVARALVQHSHKEARRHSERSVVEDAGEINLLHALRDCVSSMVVGSTVQVHTATSGKLRAISPDTSNALLRIGQEALANSVRHANPGNLYISIGFEEDCVRLSLRDDGRGFTKSGALLGFGLRGMRKRAAAVSAILEIDSEPGAGTQVEVIAPLPPSLGLLATMKQHWKYFQESVLHAKPS